MPSILSTKKLSQSQKELVLNSGIGLVERNFISIVPLDYSYGSLEENIIFTSKNAVEIVCPRVNLQGKKLFCVGDATEVLLNEKGYKVQEVANYGLDLANLIAENYSQEKFSFFCGKMRRPEIPKILKSHQIPLTEIEVYDTKLTPFGIDRKFEGVLFFSPSAVKSFCSLNELSESIAFCIGTTTAAEARKHTLKVVLGTKPSIESVLVQAIKYLR